MKRTGKSRILEAARHVIREKGIDRATVREIAKEAGLTTGAIYHHYKNKEDILYDVMNCELSITKDIMDSLEAGAVTPSTLLGRIHAQVEKRMSSLTEHRLRFYLSYEASLGNTEIQKRLAEDYLQWSTRTAALFAPAFDIPACEDAMGAAVIMIAAMDGIANLQMMGALPVDEHEIAEIYKDFFTYCIPRYLERKKTAAPV